MYSLLFVWVKEALFQELWQKSTSWSGKLNDTGGARQPPAIDKLDGRPKKYCYYCCKFLEFDCKYLDCKACNQVYLYNTICKSKSIWRDDVLCQSIIQLKQRHKNEVFNKGSYQTACSVKDKPKVAKLVGEKCMLQCRLADIVMPVLMDTGAQVSIIEKRV